MSHPPFALSGVAFSACAVAFAPALAFPVRPDVLVARDLFLPDWAVDSCPWGRGDALAVWAVCFG